MLPHPLAPPAPIPAPIQKADTLEDGMVDWELNVTLLCGEEKGNRTFADDLIRPEDERQEQFLDDVLLRTRGSIIRAETSANEKHLRQEPAFTVFKH